MNLLLRHRCFQFETEGKIVYDPDRGTMKKNIDHWAVITIEPDIAAYYRHLFYQRYGIELDKPNWDVHCSVLKGYSNTDTTKPWGWLDQQSVELHYTHEMFWNNSHVWINCYSAEFFKIREFYNVLGTDQGHITIGKFKHYQKDVIKPFKNYTPD